LQNPPIEAILPQEDAVKDCPGFGTTDASHWSESV
jgi:hypothetical protein